MSHPRVLDQLLLEEHDILGIPPAPSLDTLYRSLLQEIPLCDYLVAGSQSIRDSYVSQGFPSEQIAVIPYGVDLASFYPLSAAERAAAVDGRFRVICVAQITPRKGIHYLLDAWHRLGLPRSQAELVLVGPVADVMGSVLQKYEGTYTHIAHIRHADLRLHYGRSSVFVLPSVEDGFGYVTAEAMGCGLPVVVSSSAGSADLVEEGGNGFVVPPRSASAIQEKLELLYRDSGLREAMGRRSLELSHSRHLWSDYASRLAAHHRMLARSRTAASRR